MALILGKNGSHEVAKIIFVVNVFGDMKMPEIARFYGIIIKLFFGDLRYPRIRYAQAIDNHNLLVEFDNSEKKKYDISPLLAYEMFEPLSNPAFF